MIKKLLIIFFATIVLAGCASNQNASSEPTAARNEKIEYTITENSEKEICLKTKKNIKLSNTVYILKNLVEEKKTQYKFNDSEYLFCKLGLDDMEWIINVDDSLQQRISYRLSYFDVDTHSVYTYDIFIDKNDKDSEYTMDILLSSTTLNISEIIMGLAVTNMELIEIFIDPNNYLILV